MIKQLTSALDYGVFAEVSLAIFAVVFIAIVIRTLCIRGEVAVHQSRIVLGEAEFPTSNEHTSDSDTIAKAETLQRTAQ